MTSHHNNDKIRLPELEALWKWPRQVNPHLSEVEEECLEWSASFNAFDAETQKRVHDKGKLKQLRSGCDLMHLFFMFDEYSDKAGPEEVWDQARIQLNALANPYMPRPAGEWIGGEFTRQLPGDATSTFKRRFLATWLKYVESVARQAELRSQSRIVDLATYFPIRRHTSGALSTITLHEMDLSIPDEIRCNKVLLRMETLAVDLIVIANDILSYNKEQAVRDDEHNIITIIMQQFHLGVQAAFDYAGELSRRKMQRFYALYARLPRWMGPVGLAVQRLVDGMAQCVSGTMHWSYESERYFGKRGPAIKRTRVLKLLPKVEVVGGDGDRPVGSVRTEDDKL
ncbi:terpenoid synthase [Apiospora saccharicola]|uniref:Terpene synthase n=1 Tax=Apiospora saccharicola TaxID=335842 RepID=A0ABR1VPC2_9PEZI